MKNHNEIFSVIMPAYNAEKTIYESISSVLKQTFTHLRLYIINDNSTDNTANIIKSFNDSRIIYKENEINLGVARTRNIGIELAQGQFISFLDADDIWESSKLEKQAIAFDNGWSIVCSNFTPFKDDGISFSERVSSDVITYKDMLKTNLIGNLTGAYDAKILGKVFQKNKGHEDYIMWLDLIKRASNAYCIQENLAYYRISSNSLSANKFRAIRWQWNIYRTEENLSFLSSVFYFFHYITSALKKRAG